MADRRVFLKGRIFASINGQQESTDFASCLVTEGTRIAYVGAESDEPVQHAIKEGAEVEDLANCVVVPGFIDGHTHLLFFGSSLKKLDLTSCRSLDTLRKSIADYAKHNPELPRILCRGWHQPSTGRSALATQLDDLDSRPIFVEALDLHSTWCNTAALNDLHLTDEILEEFASQIARDDCGRPSGLLAEGAQTGLIWPHLNKIATMEEKQAALDAAFEEYIAAGYTGAIDMAMDTAAWESLKLYRKRKGALPIHIAAHWFIPHGGSRDEMASRVDEAIAQHQEWHPSKNPEFCVVGIKLICDGVVDGCTAALSRPYPDHTNVVDPFWSADDMSFVTSKAAEAGLQIAVHAIGDVAINRAIEAIASTNTPHGRHRIEHLELASEEDAQRLGQLGITASIQPVHSDPALVKDYAKLIGTQLWERAFPYKEFLDGNACVVIGTDAPTAVHRPLPNLYNATTRKSATQSQLTERTSAKQALTMSQAFHAATAGAAYSRFADMWTGGLRPGMRADFVILRCQWEAEALLEARLEQTWSGGTKVFEARETGHQLQQCTTKVD